MVAPSVVRFVTMHILALSCSQHHFLHVLKYGIPGSELLRKRNHAKLAIFKCFWKCSYSFSQNTIFCMYSNMAFLEVYFFGREIMENTLIWISNQMMPNHQFYIVKNEVYSFININTYVFNSLNPIFNVWRSTLPGMLL